jgi:RNA polymerase sigma-70 factor (ECF subfamily)
MGQFIVQQHAGDRQHAGETRRDSGIFLKVERIAEARAARAESADADAALVARLVIDEPAAWVEFTCKYDRLVMRCITKVTKGFASVSLDDVYEIRGQLYLSLVTNDHAKLRSFDPSRGSRLSSYVGMLAIHCAYDWLRTTRREPQREALAAVDEVSCLTPDPFEATAQAERAKLAARVMAGFSERDRVFAALYFAEGMEPHEIARSMKISLKTVYSKKHKIQSKLESIVACLRSELSAA